MSTVVTMPQQGLTEESSVIAEWYVKEGDAVSVGTPLFAIETGKATFDVESEAAGTVLAVFAAEGDDVPIKAPVCVIGEPGEAFERPQNAAPASAPAPEELPLQECLEALPLPELRQQRNAPEWTGIRRFRQVLKAVSWNVMLRHWLPAAERLLLK